MTQHGGLALSYLNLYDADAAWLLAHDLAARFDRPAAAIVKHANPCGAAVADTLADAYQRAFECDERSAFGGIVAVNRDGRRGHRRAHGGRRPGRRGHRPRLRPRQPSTRCTAKRKNTRILEAPAPTRRPLAPAADHRRAAACRTRTASLADRDDWRVVTQRQPTEAEWADAELAWRVCGWVKSNAIVLVKDGVAWGIGAGQQNRVESGELAASKAAGRAEGRGVRQRRLLPVPRRHRGRGRRPAWR